MTAPFIFIGTHKIKPGRREEFKKYFAPSGGFAYDEPSGIHFGRYTLKPD
jgi:hypothetical protein